MQVVFSGNTGNSSLHSHLESIHKNEYLQLDLLAGLPHKFSVFLDYTCALGFEGKPDYAYMSSLFCDLCICEGHEDDNVFDWRLPMMNPDDETPSNHTRINVKMLSREHDAAVNSQLQ
jgi:hypothetical protein